MRIIVLFLALASIFAYQIASRPTSIQSCNRKEKADDVMEEQTICRHKVTGRRGGLQRRAIISSAKIPRTVKPGTVKETVSSSEMLKVNPINRSLGRGGIFSATLKEIDHGFRQGHYQLKQAMNQFGSGNYKQGFGQLRHSFAISPLSVMLGIYTRAKKMSQAVDLTNKYLTAAKGVMMSIPPNEAKSRQPCNTCVLLYNASRHSRRGKVLRGFHWPLNFREQSSLVSAGKFMYHKRWRSLRLNQINL